MFEEKNVMAFSGVWSYTFQAILVLASSTAGLTAAQQDPAKRRCATDMVRSTAGMFIVTSFNATIAGRGAKVLAVLIRTHHGQFVSLGFEWEYF